MAYNVPLTILVRLDDGEPIELAYTSLPWPYDVRKALPEVFRELAERLPDECL